MTRRAVFIDRDGILNRTTVRDGKPYPPASVSSLEIPEGVLESLLQLKALGFLLIGVTNQPDVARGTVPKEVVEDINDLLIHKLPLEDILVCPHDDKDNCSCRKPKPGLILDAVDRYGILLEGSYMIGDRWKDIEAGKRAGCITIWIDFDYTEEYRAELPDHIASTPQEGLQFIVAREGKNGKKC